VYKLVSDDDKWLFDHGLAFLALLSFLVSFLTARMFTTFFPYVVVVTGGVHFHHFWYGLGMVIVSGWVGIVTTNLRYRPRLAIIFGIGGGLIGDEAGLLLTLGNYYSALTLPIVVSVVVVSAILILLLRSGKRLENDLRRISFGDRIVLVGIEVGGLSAIAFSRNLYLLGGLIISGGVFITVVGYLVHEKNKRAKRIKNDFG
jgi:hypothetical protein